MPPDTFHIKSNEIENCITLFICTQGRRETRERENVEYRTEQFTVTMLNINSVNGL